MKKSLLVLVAVVLFLGMANVAQSDITTGLLAYYSFNGNANDVSGNNNNGIVSGAVLTQDRFNSIDRAYSFDGIDDYIDLPSLYSYSPTNFTLNAWIELAGLSGRQMIIGKLSTTGSSGNLGFEVNGDRIALDSMDAYVQQMNGNTLLVTNQWYQATATYDGFAFKVFLNGVLDGNYPYPLGIGTNGNPWMIGAHATGTGGFYPGFSFNGIIDDVRIYNRALSDSDIMELHNEMAPVPIPGAIWLLGSGLMGLVGLRRRFTK
jgi:hypothetical protein